jgi:hypothetical protein
MANPGPGGDLVNDSGARFRAVLTTGDSTVLSH